jgi:hypothetical protein|tara:strand:+ start:158 stop:442 length:285 start_codon:yes stop_codon:yes gene_type:complete
LRVNKKYKLNILSTKWLIVFLLSIVIFHIGNIKMLSTAFYERIVGAIGEENLRGLTASQESNLIKRYNKLLNKKGGDLDEISYDDIIEVWMQVS